MTTAAATAVTRLRSEACAALEAAPDQRTLDAWRVEYLGRKGKLTGVLRGLADDPLLKKAMSEVRAAMHNDPQQ